MVISPAGQPRHEALNLICLFLLYFVQAMPYGFQSRYLPLVMRQRGVSLTSLGLYKLLLIPWVCKFFISAFLVDVYATKKFWLLSTMGLLAIASFAGTSFNATNELAFILFGLNLASATQDICVDWFAINALKKEDLGLGNTIQVGAFKLGTLFSGGVLVYFMDHITVSSGFLVLGIVYSISLLFLSSIDFDGSGDRQDGSSGQEGQLCIKERFRMLHNAPGTYWICVFVLIYKLGEQSALNMLPLFLLDQKMPTDKIGLWTGIMGQSFSIAGSILAGIVLKKTNQRTSSQTWMKYIVSIRIIPILLMTYLIVDYQNSNTKEIESLDWLLVLAMFQLFFSGVLTTVTFTLMMEISFMAPKNIQATHFSLLATCEVLGKLLLQPVVSAYTDHYGYSSGFFLFSLLYIISLISYQFRPVTVLESLSSKPDKLNKQ